MSKYHHLHPIEDGGSLRILRQWLNIIFMAGAVVGMVWYMVADHNTAVYIMIGAVVFKFVELTLRIAKL